MSDSAALSARGVHKRFRVKETGKVVSALTDISITIQRGELSALVGPDGAGTTTFLRIAAGLMPIDEGEFQVLGLSTATHAQQIQNRISYMPQRFGLYEDLSVKENLDLYADLHGVPGPIRKQRYERLLSMTDLKPFVSRLAGKLSGGMKQKLGLACTLVHAPELLLLDQPTVGVDPLSRRELWAIVQGLVSEEQLSVLVSTAYLDEAEACARVFLLHEGILLAEGPPESIRVKAKGLVYMARPLTGESARTLQARLLDDPDTLDAVPQGGEVRFIRKVAVPEHLLAGATVRQEPERLEDGFMTLLRQRKARANTPIPTVVTSNPANSSQTGEVVIEVKDLVRMFGDFTAVNRTSFTVKRGEIFGLLGPNGAGKTTTFRMLCGLLPSTSGFLRVAGVDLRVARAEARRKVGYVSQKFALYGNLSVQENLQFFGGAYGLYGRKLSQRIDAVLTEFDLKDQAKLTSGALPGGFKQRLAMAAALIHEPEILFLDEPTSGADPFARREFWRRITSLAAAGTTVIVTTHFMEEAEYCDRILIQDAGTMLALGTPLEVRQSAGSSPDHPLNMDQAFIGIVDQSRHQCDLVGRPA